ncbi:fungal-specific transcription factor domain-containing protein [Trichoderma sp. TUCIM 5745]
MFSMSRNVSLRLLNEPESMLIQYYMREAPELLHTTTLGELARSLLVLGLSDATLSSRAVLQAILALSSLHVYGDTSAVAYKANAISLLIRAMNLENSEGSSFRKLVATMLLYAYETFHPSTSFPVWAVYLCGAKRIIRLSEYFEHLISVERDTVLEWVYYHEIISQFGLIYWKWNREMHKNCHGTLVVTRNHMRSSEDLNIVPNQSGIGCSRDVLESIASMFAIILSSGSDLALSPVQLTALYEVKQSLHRVPAESSDNQHWSAQCTMLHRLAALVYLNRAVMGYSGEETQHQALVVQGIEILNTMRVCELPWPLFIIGCEATNDSQRVNIMDLFARTEEKSQSSHIWLIWQLIQASWNQDDLQEESKLNYNKKMGSIIQSVPYLPIFA